MKEPVGEGEIEAAARAMVILAQEHRVAGKSMPTRLEEAKAALIAAEKVRRDQRFRMVNARES